jgi:hypothetical protein
MRLARGITGFRGANDPALPACDFSAFRGHCYAAARVLGGRVLAVEQPGNPPASNFAQTIIQLPTGVVAVLLNAHVPVIAFAEVVGDGEATVRFTSAPRLAEVFRDFGSYEVAERSELEESLTAERCEELARAEQDQIAYWRPKHVGDVVFNFWD